MLLQNRRALAGRAACLWQASGKHVPDGLQTWPAMYAAVQEERIECLWKAIEHAIPDIRERANLVLPGSPITHQRYLNRCGASLSPCGYDQSMCQSTSC